MRSFRSLEKLARFFSYAVVAVGVLAGSASAYAKAPCYNYCPPCYNHGAPAAADPNAPAADPNAPAADPNAATQPQANQDINLAPQNNNFAAAASGEGSNVGHIGRADNVNRLNIFDSQAAMPANRVWYGFQYVDNFQASTVNPVGAGGLLASGALHRFGGEVLLTCSTSLSFMTQYADVGPGGAGNPALDAWSNPQFLLKQVVYEDCDLVVSAALGMQFPIGGIDAGEVRENTVRLLPGLLWYYNTADNIFNYGSMQYGAPLASGNQVDTFDWAFGTGYWLYRSCCCCDYVQNVSLQWEVFGKHVCGTTSTHYLGGALVEDRHVMDMTFGASVGLCNGVRGSLGYSIPVTSGFARKNEIIATVGYYF